MPLNLGVLALALFFAYPLNAQITVPPGYQIIDWRTADLTGTHAITLDDEERLFASQIDGRILILEDADRDGVADPGPAKVFRDSLQQPNGLLWHDDKLYVADFDRLITLEDLDGDDYAEVLTVLVDDLPIGLHSANGMVLGPDGLIYFGLGSTCDRCQEADPRSGTVQRFHPDGTGLEEFARGLRNVFDIAFNADGELFCGDNSFNGQTPPDYPPDELNHVVFGGDYGWPDYVGDPPDGTGTLGPIALVEPHISPDGICFYESAQFPGRKGQGLIAHWGRWSAPPDSQRVDAFTLQPDGQGSYEATLTTFGDGFAHPIDLVTNLNGDLFIADYGTPPSYSRIYKVTFQDIELSGDFSPGGSVTFTLRGQPGDGFVLFGSLGSAYLPMGERGVFRLDPTTLYRITNGVLPDSGERTFTVPILDDPVLDGVTFHHQMARLFGGSFYMGVRAPLTVED